MKRQRGGRESAPNTVLRRTGQRIDIASDIKSLTAFRRSSSEFLKQLKKIKRPVVLTVDGKGEAVIQDANAYQRLLNLAANASAEEGIRQGIEDFEHGRTLPVKEAFDKIRRKHDMPH